MPTREAGRRCIVGALTVWLLVAFVSGCSSGADTLPPGVMDAGVTATEDVVSSADGTSVCDPSLRTCAHAFTWTFTGGNVQPDTVEVRGTFNHWSPGTLRMTLSQGVWSATTTLPWGASVEYKFWAQWNNNPDNPLWVTDPGNPRVAPDGNSQIVSVACATWTCTTAPLSLHLVAPPTVTATAHSFQVRVDPPDATLDTARTVVTRNGVPLAPGELTYDPVGQVFTVSANTTVTPPVKYGYVFRVAATDGRTADLYVPFWVQATDFQWTDALMYEVMIDRFLAGGTSLAGPSGPPTDPVGDWHGGDFGGVTQKIRDGYFDAMGVNTLWISSPVLGTRRCEMGAGGNAGHCLSGYHSYFPIASGWIDGSDNDPVFTTHGVTNPIDPHFGTADDLRALVETAHTHGIRVLTDLVVNHVYADATPPEGQTPELAPLWLAHQTDPAWFNLPYNPAVNDCGNENLWDTPTSQLWNRTNCWFDPYLPDFNAGSPAVDDALSAHAVWLMENFNLDGFRVDATKQVTRDVCVALRARIASATGTTLPYYMVGEALGSVVDNVMDCVGSDRLDGSMNDPLHNSIVATFLQGNENATSFDRDLQYDEGTWTGRYAGALMGHFFGSHDVPRAISQAAGDVGDPWSHPPPAHETSPAAFARLTMAQAFLLTYRSLPILWMGDEFGMPGSVDPDNRRPMRFGMDLTPSEQTALTGLQRLGTARAAHVALRRGDRTRLWVDDGFYAYGRTAQNDIVVAVYNLDANHPATRMIPVSTLGLTGTVTDVLTGTMATVTNGNLNVTLGPLTAAVFTR